MLKPILTALVLAAATLTSGCALYNPDRSVTYQADDLKLFAYDLGRTHAGLARCKEVSPVLLDAHLESAWIALKGQARGRMSELEPVFLQGLQQPDGPGLRLHITCECANQLANESRKHNLRLYRQVELPRAIDASAFTR
jgi:hypothetical protein